MPAEHADRGPIGAIIRLLAAWRQRRAARRRVRSGSFVGLSDRMLADIGVRRGDVHAALIGAAPLCKTAATARASPPPSTVPQLPRRHAPGRRKGSQLPAT